jgi:hypothetical protein
MSHTYGNYVRSERRRGKGLATKELCNVDWRARDTRMPHKSPPMCSM